MRLERWSDQIGRFASFSDTLCGIAGYSLALDSTVERTVAARALLAGIAERGADAVGYAYRSPGAPFAVHKQRSGATKLLERISVPEEATKLLVHVRDYTKGHPSLAANNHPVRHGSIVGIHNGIIENDDELFERYGIARAEPGMTVDSEIIFALAERARVAPCPWSWPAAVARSHQEGIVLCFDAGRSRARGELRRDQAAQGRAARGDDRRRRERQDRRPRIVRTGSFLRGGAASCGSRTGRRSRVSRASRTTPRRCCLTLKNS